MVSKQSLAKPVLIRLVENRYSPDELNTRCPFGTRPCVRIADLAPHRRHDEPSGGTTARGESHAVVPVSITDRSGVEVVHADITTWVRPSNDPRAPGVLIDMCTDDDSRLGPGPACWGSGRS